MKFTLVFTAMLLLIASSSFAAADLAIGTFTNTGLVLHGDESTASSTTASIGRLSTGVGLAVKVDASAGAGYSMATQHKNGSKIYGSSYDSTALYSADATVGTAKISGNLSATDSADFVGTGWKKL